MTYTFVLYGFTNKESKKIEDCLIFYEDFSNPQSLCTYSTRFYQNHYFLNEIPLKFEDFDYVVEIVVDMNTTYIVKHSKDLIKNLQNKDGVVNIKFLSKLLKRTINGFILFDIKTSNTNPYIPYLHLEKQCVVRSKIFKKRMPMDRMWTSVENCQKYDRFKCINSNSCKLKYDIIPKTAQKSTTKPLTFTDLMNMTFPKIIGCEDSKFKSLMLEDLHKVLIPYKLYTLTEYETKPYRTYQSASHIKPIGLWFALGDEWLHFIIDNDFTDTKYKYLYEVTVDKTKMLIINDLKELYDFSKKYGVTDKEEVQYINWQKVVNTTKQYGILIHPNIKSILFRYKNNIDSNFDFLEYFKGMEWYLTWDVSSGVVWNPKGIKSFRLIYKQDNGELIDYK